MALNIIDSTATTRNVAEVQDFAAGKFACIGGFAEPIVSSNNTIDGTGSSVNPLVVNPSVDAGNTLVIGTDGRLFVPTAVVNPFTFDITDGVTTQTVDDAETVTFLDANDITVVVSATNTVTVSNIRPAQSAACGLGYFTGV